MDPFRSSVLLLSLLVFFLLVNTWIHIGRRHRRSCWRPSDLAVHFPLRGRARWVGGRRWRLSRRRRSQKGASFSFPLQSFQGEENYVFFQLYGYFCCILLSMLVAKLEPTLVTMMHIRFVLPSGHVGGNTGRKTVRPHFPPWLDVFFWLTSGPLSFFGELVIWILHTGRARHPVLGKRHFSSNQLSVEFLSTWVVV